MKSIEEIKEIIIKYRKEVKEEYGVENSVKCMKSCQQRKRL